jgi:hypothetical protein
MKRSSLALIGLVLIALDDSTAWPQAGAIVVRNSFDDCFIRDDGPKLHTLRVVHAFNVGTIASRFKVQVDEGLMLDYVSETYAFPSTLGDFRNGISVCYGSCTVGDLLLGTITYQGYGTSPTCGFIRVVPHPDAETLDVIRCDNDLVQARTYVLEVTTATHNCNTCSPHMDGIEYPGTPELFGCQPLPTSAATWGAIKALYR